MNNIHSYYGRLEENNNIHKTLDVYMAEEWIRNIIDKHIKKFAEDLQHVLYNAKKDSDKAVVRINKDLINISHRVSSVEEKIKNMSKEKKPSLFGRDEIEKKEMEDVKYKIKARGILVK